MLGYAAWLEDNDYAHATQCVELTTLMQGINLLKSAGHLPISHNIQLSLKKPLDSSTYCWRVEEVQAMLGHCRSRLDLQWFVPVIASLACTGLRIAELASLRHTDIDFVANVIRMTDESMRARSKNSHKPRETKNSRSRSFPISAELREILKGMKPHPDGTVFHGPRGGKLQPDTVRKTLIRDVLTPLAKHFPSSPGETGFLQGRLHSFRHYFCSRCATENVPELVVMKWLGHRNSDMLKIYYHLHNEEAQRQMQRVKFIGKTDGAVPSVG